MMVEMVIIVQMKIFRRHCRPWAAAGALTGLEYMYEYSNDAECSRSLHVRTRYTGKRTRLEARLPKRLVIREVARKRGS